MRRASVAGLVKRRRDGQWGLRLTARGGVVKLGQVLGRLGERDGLRVGSDGEEVGRRAGEGEGGEVGMVSIHSGLVAVVEQQAVRRAGSSHGVEGEVIGEVGGHSGNK